MRWDKATHGILTANTAITDVVGDRIYPEIAPQSAPLPLIIYSLISVDTKDAKSSAHDLGVYSVQISIFAKAWDNVQEIKENVRASIERYRGNVNNIAVHNAYFSNEQNVYVAAEEIHQTVQDYDIWLQKEGITIDAGTVINTGNGSNCCDLVLEVVTDAGDNTVIDAQGNTFGAPYAPTQSSTFEVFTVDTIEASVIVDAGDNTVIDAQGNTFSMNSGFVSEKHIYYSNYDAQKIVILEVVGLTDNTVIPPTHYDIIYDTQRAIVRFKAPTRAIINFIKSLANEL